MQSDGPRVIKNRGAGVALVVLVAIAAAWISLSPPRPPQQRGEAAGKQQEKTAKSQNYSPLFHRSMWVASGDFVHSYKDEIIAVGTVVIALFTIVLGIGTVFLTSATRDLVKGSEDTAKRQLRAHVHVAKAQVRYGRTPAERYITVIVKNYGQTPALKVSSLYAEHVREWPLRTILPPFPDDMRRGIGPLPPGRESIQRIPIGSLSAWEEGELRAGRAGVYFWSKVSYLDIYGDPHVTNTRLVCKDDGLTSGLMSACEEGNDET
jgi:hypothetical protein